MNRGHILLMAEEAGLYSDGTPDSWDDEAIICFAHLVAAAEREACASLCDTEAEKWEGDDGPICAEARMCAVAIRARGDA